MTALTYPQVPRARPAKKPRAVARNRCGINAEGLADLLREALAVAGTQQRFCGIRQPKARLRFNQGLLSQLLSRQRNELEVTNAQRLRWCILRVGRNDQERADWMLRWSTAVQRPETTRQRFAIPVVHPVIIGAFLGGVAGADTLELTGQVIGPAPRPFRATTECEKIESAIRRKSVELVPAGKRIAVRAKYRGDALEIGLAVTGTEDGGWIEVLRLR